MPVWISGAAIVLGQLNEVCVWCCYIPLSSCLLCIFVQRLLWYTDMVGNIRIIQILLLIRIFCHPYIYVERGIIYKYSYLAVRT